MPNEPICMYTWISEKLMGDQTSYIVATLDEERASSYWGVDISSGHIRLIENEEQFIYRSEDIVPVAELNSPQGAKLKRLFDHAAKAVWSEDLDSRRLLHVFYFNITKIGNSEAIGRTYFYNNHLYIVLTIKDYAGLNAFSHELGHALYFSNPKLMGNDPVTGTKHHNKDGNLMYPSISLTELLQLEQQQLNAVNNSYLVNPDALSGFPLSNINTSIE
ncbi:hypothetical protein [Paenibacillus sp. O199]|uniref:hypothetical protein n=1 Tax=Paenibacillus sp. O199 TaxID=1643925 RepID=UPI0007BF670B|nr:hypothetical protein [Paenibacillus sp. O199]